MKENGMQMQMGPELLKDTHTLTSATQSTNLKTRNADTPYIKIYLSLSKAFRMPAVRSL